MVVAVTCCRRRLRIILFYFLQFFWNICLVLYASVELRERILNRFVEDIVLRMTIFL